MRRAIAFALALSVTLPLPSCGACLIVERQPCELKLGDTNVRDVTFR